MRRVVTLLALLSIWLLLVFREVAMTEALEAGQHSAGGMQVLEPSAITWTEHVLEGARGVLLQARWDPGTESFGFVYDSGAFITLNPRNGATRARSLPFIPGLDLPLVVHPRLLTCYWPAVDPRYGFFLTSDNALVKVDMRSLRVVDTDPALPAIGAPRRFEAAQTFWHIAHDPKSDGLLLVVRDRASGSPLCSVQFSEPKRGFATLQDFEIDGARGEMYYTVDGTHGVQKLGWDPKDPATLRSSALVLPTAPFHSGSQQWTSAWQLPIQRLLQFPYGEATEVLWSAETGLVALRAEAPMLSLVPDPTARTRWNYFPRFQGMGPNAIAPISGGVVLAGWQTAPEPGAPLRLGLEVFHLADRAVTRPQEFATGAHAIPEAVARDPRVVASTAGEWVALTASAEDRVWLAHIEAQDPASLAAPHPPTPEASDPN